MELVPVRVKAENQKIILKEKEYILRAYTLDVQEYFEDKYGMEWDVITALKKEPNKFVRELAYELLDENGKKDYPTLQDFKNKTTVQEFNETELANKVMAAIGFSLVLAEGGAAGNGEGFPETKGNEGKGNNHKHNVLFAWLFRKRNKGNDTAGNGKDIKGS